MEFVKLKELFALAAAVASTASKFKQFKANDDNPLHNSFTSI